MNICQITDGTNGNLKMIKDHGIIGMERHWNISKKC